MSGTNDVLGKCFITEALQPRPTANLHLPVRWQFCASPVEEKSSQGKHRYLSVPELSILQKASDLALLRKKLLIVHAHGQEKVLVEGDA